MIEIFLDRVQYDCLLDCTQGIVQVCKIMNMPLKNKVLNLGLLYSHIGMLDYNQHTYQDAVDYLNYTSFEDLFRAAMRSWFWQTCNEFGFYATTDSGNSFFGSKIPLNYYIDLCMDVFGDEYNVDHIKAGIENTLKLYGGTENYNGTNEHVHQLQVDHFNKTDGKEWNQRFWNNSIFYKSDGPIFLMIGGEGDSGPYNINNENSPFLIWAKKYGADTYFIEHRGYGKSLPANDSSLENLKYISSEQALADIANFIEAINEIRPNSKWITFGGSYPGSLSAWFREKYPQHSVGAVASSAPMLPKVDFFEYKQVVEKVIYEFNPKCGENLKAAFTDIESKLYSIEGRKIINELFKVSLLGKSPDFHSFQAFLDDLTLMFEYFVQYGIDLEPCCESMLNETNSPLENLASLNTIEEDDSFGKQTEIGNEWNSGRTWQWQTCTEFGWYQTTDSGRNMFGAAVSVDFYITKDCFKAFNKNITDIAAGVEYTLKNYGGLEKYNATNIIFINGSHDPWHALSLYTNNTSSSGITSILINGTSHCQDMQPPTDRDSTELKAARQKIGQLIGEWIK
uniref:Uncharacterized protein n=1 Tax=Panagrolaimus sp. PS1159 TaxID=55785 RepID=A0AC35FNE2_9BILA